MTRHRDVAESGRSPERPPPAAGLCPRCEHVRKVVSAKGAVFWMCEKSRSDARLPRYPAQPRMVCTSFTG